MKRIILIVDDAEINRMMLSSILSEEYEVLEAKNGEEALAVMRRTHKSLSAVLLDIVMPVLDGYAVLEQMHADTALAQIPVIVMTGNTEGDAEIKALTLGANDFIAKPYVPVIIRRRLQNMINLRETAATVNALQRDRLTGLYTREAFFQRVENLVKKHPPGYYVMACFDINNFKVINDQYGSQKGDEVLRQVANIFRTGFEALDGLVSRIMADNFAVLYPTSYLDSAENARMREEASILDGSIAPISFSIGRYIVDDLSLSASAMYDRAAIAEASIKGRFDAEIAQYDESMREQLLYEQEIVNEMKGALAKRQFEVWFQPQYNHSSGALIGAEALVRWRHPVKGLVSPGEFIPVFERNGFVYELDKFVWEQTCAQLRKWIDEGRSPLPVSVNVSRYDIFRDDLTETIKSLVHRYDIPIDLLRLEITESAFAKSTKQIISVVRSLVDYGFTMEIDDFGSGYSSLNTLKDVPAQIVKLDMRFLESNENSDRGGNILESIVRMTKWLGMSVIAEGVETREQADYLKSIGCNYVQGYLYAKPMPAAEYESLIRNVGKEEKLIALETVENLDNNLFWDPKSMDTLIFNTYVGGACIFEWHNERIEILRANEKYAQIIGGRDRTVSDALNLRWEEHMDATAAAATRNAIERAIQTGDDATYEAVYSDLFGVAGKTWLRTTFRVIARTANRYLLYATNENLTTQRVAEQKERAVSERLQAVLDNVNSGVTAVIVRGEEVEYLFVNDRYFEMFGFTREQYETEVKNVFDLIHPDDRAWVLQAVGRINTTGEPTTLEYRVVCRDGSVVWERNTISVTRFDGIDSPVQLGIATDITEQKNAELKIQSLNENLEGMMNDMPGGFLRLRAMPDGALSVAYANESFCRLRGMTAEEILAAGREDATHTVHPDDLAMVLSAVSEAIETGETCNIQYRMQHADGKYIPVNAFGRVTKNEAGETFINVYYADLSEEERRDLTLRETMPYVLTAIMKYSNDLTFAKDKDFRYICCSPAFVKFTRQKTESDVIGRTDYEFWTKEEADHFRGDDMRLFESGEPLIDYIEPIPSDDGVQHYCRTSKYILRDSTGEIVGMYGIGRDVTKERTALEQLTLLTNNIPGGIASYEGSPAGVRNTYFNDGFCNMMGYTREEYAKLCENNITSITYEEDLPGVHACMQALMHGDDTLDYTYRIHHKNGGIIWVNARGRVTERRGDVCSFSIVLFDVTRDKLAEEAARIHEQEMRLAISQLGKMICEYDPISQVLTVPEAFAAQFNMPASIPDVPESVIRAGVISADTLDAFSAFYNAILSGEKTGSAEYCDQRADGSLHWSHMEFSTIFDSVGKPVKTIIAVEDITEQHRRYELEQSRPNLGEENLLIHALFNLTTGETLEYAYRDGSEVPMAERTAFLFGGDNLDTIIINEDERAQYRALNDQKNLLAHYQRGETELSIDYRRRMPDGGIMWVRNLLHMVREPGGSDILLFEYCYSIETEKLSELMYGSLVNENYDYVARINGKSGRFVVMINTVIQDDLIPQSGGNFDEVAVAVVNSRVHPDDRKMALRYVRVKNIRQNLRNKDRFRFTFRILTADGEIRYKRITQFYLDRERDIIIFTREDVTELMQEEIRKNELLENALKAANEESRMKEREASERLGIILNNVNGGMSATTLSDDGCVRYLFTNDAYFTMFGYDRETFIATLPHGMRDLVYPEDIAEFEAAVRDTERNGSATAEFRMCRKDGSVIWVRNISASCRLDGVDAPVYVVVSNDITGEKAAEDSLRMSREQYRIAASIGGRKTARYDIKQGVYYNDDDVLTALGFGSVVENVPQAFIDAGIVMPECVPAFQAFYEKIRSGEKNCTTDVAFLGVNGAYVWTRGEATVICDADGAPSQAIIVFSDISEQREKEAVYRKWQQSLQQRPKENYTLFRCNLNKDASFESVEGELLQLAFSPEAVTFNDRTREHVEQSVYAEDREAYLAFLNADTLLANYYRGVRIKTLEYREIMPDNTLRWLRLTVELVEYPSSTDIEAYLMFEDIDENKRVELRTKERAETDPLTGVLNRAAFSQAVEHMIAGPNAAGTFALLMLDLDGFKLINDTFGHTVGDTVLVDVAKALRGILRHGDVLGRLGGDEFLICLPGMGDNANIENKAGQICMLLHRALNLDVYVSVSIGIAVYPRDGKDFQTLYRKMDTALYTVKNNGKNSYAFFHKSMGDAYGALDRIPSVAGAAALNAKMKKRRMLIVDDNKASLSMLAGMFADSFTIESAKDGDDALQCLRRYGTSVAVVLLDLVMPGMDGFAVLENMRGSLEMRTIPVIVVSGMDERETSLRAIQCGAADYVVKPVNPDLLRLRVQSAISKAENDRLRAQNSLLLMHNTETVKYRTALASAGATAMEYEPESGLFLYDPSNADYIAGSFNDRTLWDILREDRVATEDVVQKLQRLVADAAENDARARSGEIVTLKTPSHGAHTFRVCARKRMGAMDAHDRIILTFIDVEGEAPPR